MQISLFCFELHIKMRYFASLFAIVSQLTGSLGYKLALHVLTTDSLSFFSLRMSNTVGPLASL